MNIREVLYRNLTPAIRELREKADDEALALNHQFVRVEHLLLAMTRSPKTREKLISFIGYGEYGDLDSRQLTPSLAPLAQYVMRFAERIAEQKNEEFANKHVLQSIAMHTNLRERLRKANEKI